MEQSSPNLTTKNLIQEDTFKRSTMKWWRKLMIGHRTTYIFDKKSMEYNVCQSIVLQRW